MAENEKRQHRYERLIKLRKRLWAVKRQCEGHDEPYAPTLISDISDAIEEFIKGELSDL